MKNKLSARCLALLALAIGAVPASAHFPFVVPAADGKSAQLFMSEALAPDEEVNVGLLSGIKLSLRDSAGKLTPIQTSPGEHAFNVPLTGEGTRVVVGTADLGVMQRGTGPAHWLVYYPKTVIGDAFDKSTDLPAETPVELRAVKATDGVKLRLLAAGKPVADKDVRVILPDGTEDDYKTDADGLTKSFPDTGRFGAWARHWIDTPGETAGKPYAQLRQYATFVFDVPGAPGSAASTPAHASAPLASSQKKSDENPHARGTNPHASGANPHGAGANPHASGANPHGASVPPTTVPSDASANSTTSDGKLVGKLPQPVSSFGAIAAGDYVYVYGGHTATRHEYNTAAVTGGFFRAPLTDLTKWENLPGGPAIQGMNLAAYNGKVIRVGGMQPRNAPGTDADNWSIVDAAVFDPENKQWTALAPLPEGRSSHDVVVVGDTAYVIGGWVMKGDEEETWPETTLTLDLKNPAAKWQEISQPFARRAFMAAALDGKIYVMGGFNAFDEACLDVDVYDTATKTWSKGPNLPGKEMNGFAPAAVNVNGTLYLSVGTGELFTLSGDASKWEPAGKTRPRIVHRMTANATDLIILGGAAGPTMTDTIEAVPLKK